MTFTESNSAAISGELRVVDVELRNVGPVDMGPVYFAAEHPDCVHLLASDPAAADAEPFRELYEEKYKEPTVYTGGSGGVKIRIGVSQVGRYLNGELYRSPYLEHSLLDYVLFIYEI